MGDRTKVLTELITGTSTSTSTSGSGCGCGCKSGYKEKQRVKSPSLSNAVLCSPPNTRLSSAQVRLIGWWQESSRSVGRRERRVGWLVACFVRQRSAATPHFTSLPRGNMVPTWLCLAIHRWLMVFILLPSFSSDTWTLEYSDKVPLLTAADLRWLVRTSVPMVLSCLVSLLIC